MPRFEFGFRANPSLRSIRNPLVGRSDQSLPRQPIEAVSLFCGCGGLDLGLLGGFEYLGETFAPLPFSVRAGYDNDPGAIETYRLNLGDHGSLCDLAQVDLSTLPRADLLLGGFPCQDFSSCGPKQGFEGKRGQLYRVLAEYMRLHQPLVVVGENVPHLARMRGGEYVEIIAEDFASQGYRVKVWHLYCPDYGLPQHRHRVFFVCVRNDLPGHPAPPAMTHFMRHRPIEAAIDDLKCVQDEAVPNQSQFFVATVATKGAGQGDQVSVRGRVAYAVRANPKARVHFHYELPRRLTVRECARLQSFPDEFVFPHSTSVNVLHIGNAVPPIVAHAVGRELAAYFELVRGIRQFKGQSKCRPPSTRIVT
jgi:DNA (cytosine-5)-methyltransferase 1